MDAPDTDFEQFREHIQSSLNGDLGDDAQEEVILALFEGQLKHQMGTMNVWAGGGVGSMGSKDNILIWS